MAAAAAPAKCACPCSFCAQSGGKCECGCGCDGSLGAAVFRTECVGSVLTLVKCLCKCNFCAAKGGKCECGCGCNGVRDDPNLPISKCLYIHQPSAKRPRSPSPAPMATSSSSSSSSSSLSPEIVSMSERDKERERNRYKPGGEAAAGVPVADDADPDSVQEFAAKAKAKAEEEDEEEKKKKKAKVCTCPNPMAFGGSTLYSHDKLFQLFVTNITNPTKTTRSFAIIKGVIRSSLFSGTCECDACMGTKARILGMLLDENSGNLLNDVPPEIAKTLFNDKDDSHKIQWRDAIETAAARGRVLSFVYLLEWAENEALTVENLYLTHQEKPGGLLTTVAGSVDKTAANTMWRVLHAKEAKDFPLLVLRDRGFHGKVSSLSMTQFHVGANVEPFLAALKAENTALAQTIADEYKIQTHTIAREYFYVLRRALAEEKIAPLVWLVNTFKFDCWPMSDGDEHRILLQALSSGKKHIVEWAVAAFSLPCPLSIEERRAVLCAAMRVADGLWSTTSASSLTVELEVADWLVEKWPAAFDASFFAAQHFQFLKILLANGRRVTLEWIVRKLDMKKDKMVEVLLAPNDAGKKMCLACCVPQFSGMKTWLGERFGIEQLLDTHTHEMGDLTTVQSGVADVDVFDLSHHGF